MGKSNIKPINTLISFILVFSFLLALSGCGSQKNSNNDNGPNSSNDSGTSSNSSDDSGTDSNSSNDSGTDSEDNKEPADEEEITLEHKYKNRPSDFYTETYRQQLHYSPFKNWINDPNGMVYYEGEYHLFYQYNPKGNQWGNMSWGHAVSKDLVFWEELDGVAIAGDGNGTIYSGCCVVDSKNTTGFFNKDGKGLVALYTLNGSTQQQSIAYSTDKGRTWVKYNGGKPVITNAQDPANNRDFRDPKVFWHEEGKCWIMVVAGGPLRIYSSKNLIDWKFESSYDKTITIKGKRIEKITTECPDFFRLKVEGTDKYKWVMNGCGRYYMLGDFEKIDGNWMFVPDSNTHYEMNFGPDSYAAQTYSDTPDGRRIMINWMNNWSYASKTTKWTGAFNGAMTLQNELTLVETKDGIRLAQKPISEMKALRMGKPVTYSGGASNKILSDFSADMYELDLELSSGKVTVEMFGGDVVLTYNNETGDLVLNRADTGLSGSGRTKLMSVNKATNIKIFVDTASVEIYADNGLNVGTFLIFGTIKRGLTVKYEGNGTLKASAYKLNSIWRDLNTSVVEPNPLGIADAVLVVGEEKTVTINNYRLFSDNNVKWTIKKGSQLVKIVATEKGSITLKGLAEGEITLEAERGKEKVQKTIKVSTQSFITNLSNWATTYGEWDNKYIGGLSGSHTGDGFYISGDKVDDSFKLTLDANCKDAIALGIVLGCKTQTAPKEESYVINFDFDRKNFRIFKFANNGASDVKAYTFAQTGFTPEKGKTYKIEIVYSGNKLSYKIDGHTVFENISVDLANKYVGLMVYNGSAIFNNIMLEN